MTTPLYLQTSLCSNRQVGDGVFLMSLRAPAITGRARPGQFVMLHLSDIVSPLLPRPFSIHDIHGDKLLLLYRRTGRGTRMISEMKPGQTIDVIGPLGNGFNPRGSHPAILVAGGLGLAPMPFLIKKLKALGVKTQLLYGCHDRRQLLGLHKAKALVSTEDGSCGRRGMVTDLLRHVLQKSCSCCVYACGPWAMLKRVSQICLDRGLSCQVSLEARMACGLGACQGCAVRSTDGGYLHVCSDGPVFDACQIDWDQEPPI